VAPNRKSSLIASSPLVQARIAGLVAVIVLATGTFAGSVASRLIVRGDAAATSSHIAASPELFRLGAISSLVMMVAWLFYAILLYGFLKPVSRVQAMTMLSLVVASVPLYMLNQANQFVVPQLASGGLNEQVKLVLDLHRNGNLIAGIFFGLWLFPLGLLVYRSGFLPKFIGVLLIVGSPGYIVLFFQAVLAPGSERTLWSNPFLVVTHLAELALMLWLLIKGVNAETWERRHGEPGALQAA
jgi:hypothetical protein